MKHAIKIATLSLIALFAVSFSYKPPVDGETTQEVLKWRTWNNGYTELKGAAKIGLVDVYTEWCGWCKRMDRDTYAEGSVIKKINRDFVPIKFNPEQQGIYYIDSTPYSGRQLYAMLSNNNPSGYPTTFFLIPKGGIMYVERIPGYKGAKDFGVLLDKIVAYAHQPQRPSVRPTPASNK